VYYLFFRICTFHHDFVLFEKGKKIRILAVVVYIKLVHQRRELQKPGLLDQIISANQINISAREKGVARETHHHHVQMMASRL